MPFFIAPLLSFLSWVIRFCFGWIGSALPWIAGFFGSTIIQFLIGLGWGVTAFTGFNVLTSELLQLATSGFTGVPSAVPQLLGLMWFDKAINLVLSTAIMLLTIKGVRAGTLTKSAWNPPGNKTGGFQA
ncbi:DUF2523 domain-containing protein [Vibrio vulnificus]|nr:DUF2523 domain-containing protein [Vibrio vulnificus]EGR0093626.1 DUF2523 domain-containing protein [Vibrio vulnificus]EIJ0948499.1 DUF2523 domain-containing protein [Vibrio vulnificus]